MFKRKIRGTFKHNQRSSAGHTGAWIYPDLEKIVDILELVEELSDDSLPNERFLD